MTVQLEVTGLIKGLEKRDPRIYQAMVLLNNQLQDLVAQIEPLLVQSTIPDTGGTSSLLSPGSFTAVATGITIRFAWTPVSGAVNYEVRRGDVWETADFLFRTSNSQADIDPLLYGTYTFLIKTIDSSGDYSAVPSSVIFVVELIGKVTITHQVIDNNVLLYWTVPVSQFTIRHYLLTKDVVPVGVIGGTFVSFFETVAGTYTYCVVPVDIIGNEGARSDITVTVNTPPDFAIQDSRLSTLLGTRVNVILADGPELIANWTAETFQNHFTTRAWLTPQNQVDAGYPIYIQPAATTGSYEEIFDYGVVIQNVIFVVTYNMIAVTPLSEVTVVVKMAVSTDGVSYSSFASGSTQFYSSFRYFKLRLEFAGADDKALLRIYNLRVDINVKRENDGGEVAALSSDSGGTQVLFTKDFKDVESITATVKSTTEPFIAIIIWVDIPNPTFFHVMAFDSTGNRVSKTVEWKARGIV